MPHDPLNFSSARKKRMDHTIMPIGQTKRQAAPWLLFVFSDWPDNIIELLVLWWAQVGFEPHFDES